MGSELSVFFACTVVLECVGLVVCRAPSPQSSVFSLLVQLCLGVLASLFAEPPGPQNERDVVVLVKLRIIEAASLFAESPHQPSYCLPCLLVPFVLWRLGGPKRIHSFSSLWIHMGDLGHP